MFISAAGYLLDCLPIKFNASNVVLQIRKVNKNNNDKTNGFLLIFRKHLKSATGTSKWPNINQWSVVNCVIKNNSFQKSSSTHLV